MYQLFLRPKMKKCNSQQARSKLENWFSTTTLKTHFQYRSTKLMNPATTVFWSIYIPQELKKRFNVLLTLIEVKWIFHGIRHPQSDGPSGKADAQHIILLYHFQDFNQSISFHHKLQEEKEYQLHLTWEFSMYLEQNTGTLVRFTRNNLIRHIMNISTT